MKVTLPYDPEWKALHWAKEHCPSYITNQAKTTRLKSFPGGWVRDEYVVYSFGNEKDAMIFLLRWA